MKWRAILLGVLAAVGWLLLTPGTALGHAALRSSDPVENAFLQRAPTQITLTFTEPPDPKSSGLKLLDASGKAVPLGAVDVSNLSVTVPVSNLQPGIYNVLWFNVSRTDGHALQGSFPFTVLKPDGSVPDVVNTLAGLGNGSDPPPVGEGVAVRALSLLGLVIVAAAAMLFLLWPEAPPPARRALLIAVYAGVGVLFIATGLNFVTIRDNYSGTPIKDVVFHTPSGGYWLSRLGIALLIAVLGTFVADAPRRTGAALVGAVGIYLWAYTATSHAAAGGGSVWARALDFSHGLTAVLWIGAVIGVAIGARIGATPGGFKALMPRFSLAASVLVFVLLASGVFSAFVEIDHPSKLWETRYGVTLLVKLGAMVPLLAVAGYNARWGKRLLLTGERRLERRFLHFATTEIGLGIAVFALAAVLTQTTVSKSIIESRDAKPFRQASQADDLQVSVAIDPSRTGLNTYRVDLANAAKAPVDADRVRLTFRYRDDQTVGPSTLTLARTAPGAYLGQGPYLTLEGQWRVEVEIRRADVNDTVAFFDVRPAGAQVTGGVIGGKWDDPAPGLSWNEFGGLVMLVAGLGFALSRTPLRRLGREYSWAANGLTMFGFGFGVLLLFGVHSHDQLTTTLPKNPIFPDSNSIATGRTLYQQNCAACHGLNGVPPKGLDLNPYPLDLTVHVPQHPEGQIHNFIANGIPGSAMRAWNQGQGKLTDEQIWHLVNYLRTLGSVDQ